METMQFEGREYHDSENVRFSAGQIVWARKILAAPNVVYQNGKHSHDAAGAILESAEDYLIAREVWSLRMVPA